MALAQLRAVFSEDKGAVGVLRPREFERIQDKALPQRVGQVLLRTYNMSDPHLRIVHYERKEQNASKDGYCEKALSPSSGTHVDRLHKEQHTVTTPTASMACTDVGIERGLTSNTEVVHRYSC